MSQTAFDILGTYSEDAARDVIDDLPIHPSAFDMLDDANLDDLRDVVVGSDGAPHIHFGTRPPRFGTHTPDFGDDVLGRGGGHHHGGHHHDHGSRPSTNVFWFEDDDDYDDVDDFDFDFVHAVHGDIVETYTGPSALDILNASPAEPELGVGDPDGDEPEFGTQLPDFGVDDGSYGGSPVFRFDVDGLKSVDSEYEPDVFRNMDMMLTDNIDYGDDKPGMTEINALVGAAIADMEEREALRELIADGVVETYTGPSALSMLDDSPAEPEWGVGDPDGDAPEFGTNTPEFGDFDPNSFDGTPVYRYDVANLKDVDPEYEHDDFRNLDMLLTDDVDYGDDAPGTTEINGVIDEMRRDLVGRDMLDAALDSMSSEVEDQGGEPGYDEILGEQMHVAESQIADYVARVAAMGTPLVRRTNPRSEMRDWELSFGPASAPAGQVLVFTERPQATFRVEKVIATDSSSLPGTGTRIMQISVGQKIQRPGNGSGAGALTNFFASSALGNGTLWDTCEPALSISVVVSFVQACTFDMSVFGKCVI